MPSAPAGPPDDALTPELLAELAAALTDRQRTLTDDLERVRADLQEIRDSRSAQSDDDEHDPEGGTMSAQWSHSTGIRADLEARLVEVDRALLRMADGTYGTCVRCGRAIPPERLLARPSADRCVTCAQQGPAVLG